MCKRLPRGVKFWGLRIDYSLQARRARNGRLWLHSTDEVTAAAAMHTTAPSRYSACVTVISSCEWLAGIWATHAAAPASSRAEPSRLARFSHGRSRKPPPGGTKGGRGLGG